MESMEYLLTTGVIVGLSAFLVIRVVQVLVASMAYKTLLLSLPVG